MEPISVAIVGTGSIARTHVEALRTLSDQATVVAATDIDPSRARAFRSRYGIPGQHESLSALLTAVRPDLVHVCTPPGAHAGQALSCLQAGSSVLVEKPPALSLHDLYSVAAAQGRDGPWFATVFQHRFGSGAQRLARLMRDGVLGRPLVAMCTTAWFRDQSYFDEPWRGRWETEGGGPTMGHGIHQMDLLSYLLGDWTEVSAIARRQVRRTETEDLSLAHVTFANGAVASVVNSLLSPRQESYLRFDFERATVELTHLYGYSDDSWQITPAPGFETDVRAAWAIGERGTASGHRAQFAAVLTALRQGSAPPADSASALRSMRLIAGIYASALLGRPVRAGELGPDSPFYQRMCGDGTGLALLSEPAARPREFDPYEPEPAGAGPDGGAAVSCRASGAAVRTHGGQS
jgi:predicted dehydrogenase